MTHGVPRSLMANVLDCDIVVCAFEIPVTLLCSLLDLGKAWTSLCTILICMQKHSQHNKNERTQFFRKIYLPHFIRNGTKGLRKGYCVRGELESEQSYNILTPSSSGYSSTSFSSCGAAQPGALRAQLSAESSSHCSNCNNWLQTLSPNSDLQLTRTSCGTGLYNCLTSTCFSERRICTQFNLSTVKVIPSYLRPDCTCYSHRCISYLTARPGRRSICYTYPPSYGLNSTITVLVQA